MHQIIKQACPNRQLFEAVNFAFMNFLIFYRHEILTSELEKEKLFRFSHISIGNVGKTE